MEGWRRTLTPALSQRTGRGGKGAVESALWSGKMPAEFQRLRMGELLGRPWNP
jgi:hypothetical protein